MNEKYQIEMNFLQEFWLVIPFFSRKNPIFLKIHYILKPTKSAEKNTYLQCFPLFSL